MRKAWDCLPACLPAGPIERFRVLGDTQHTSKIAFLEFKSVENAREAIKCSGAILGQ